MPGSPSIQPVPSVWRSKWFVPTLAIGLGVVAAAVQSTRAEQSSLQEPSTASASLPPAPMPPPALQEPEGEGAISGEIREVIQVPNYTYLRLDGQDGNETWAAVRSVQLSPGQRVRVKNGAWMTDFSSPTLKRTFPSIYFGVLDGSDEKSADTPELDEGPDTVDRSALPELPAPTEDTPDAAVTVGKVKPAEGPSGFTVSALRARRLELVGKSVRVRGVVVKAISGIMDRTFAHLRDNSGRGDGADDDLTVTLSTTPRVGETLLLEGVVGANRDFGSGYQYDLILENARVVE